MDKNSKLYRFGKPFIIMVVVFLIIGTIIYFIFQTGKHKANEDYVYTTIEENNRLTAITVPTINLKGKKIDKINEELKRVYENDKRYFVREYYYTQDLDGKILNLVTLTRNIARNGDGRYINRYRSYFINVDTSAVIDSSTILKKHNLTEEDVVKKVEDKIKEMYQKEIDDGYISEYSCDIECFKDMRNIDTNFDNLTIGTKSGKIVAYLPFYEYVDFGNNYTRDDFLFYIEK